MPVAKKERTDHKCLWQRKKDQTTKCWGQMKNKCPNQASKQLTPNERNKTVETTFKNANGGLPANIRWKKHTTKSQMLVANEKWLP